MSTNHSVLPGGKRQLRGETGMFREVWKLRKGAWGRERQEVINFAKGTGINEKNLTNLHNK